MNEEIEAISGQASGEQALKQMLSKVEEGFKECELIVLPHKDSKDIFILGGTDDVQAELDDGRVMMATIASSRYVGPIQNKVNGHINASGSVQDLSLHGLLIQCDELQRFSQDYPCSR